MSDKKDRLTLIEALKEAGIDPRCKQYFVIGERANMTDVREERNVFIYRADETMLLDTLSAAVRATSRRVQYHLAVRILGALLQDLDTDEVPEQPKPEPIIALDS